MLSVVVSSFCLFTFFLWLANLPLNFSEHAEADCFFCFTALMGEIRDFFIKTLDDSEGGIKQMMARLSNMVKEKDKEIFDVLKEQELYPQYYSFRLVLRFFFW